MEILIVGPSIAPGRKGAALLRAAGAVAGDARVMAVDGGLDHCARAGLRADLGVGDWDSLRRKSLAEKLPAGARLTLVASKDRSDLFHALRALPRLLKGAKARSVRLSLVGFAGGRADHHLASLLELHAYALRSHPAVGAMRLTAESEDYHWVSPNWGPWRLSLKAGTCVSVFALQGVARGVTIRGLRYPLRNARLAGSSHGLSNEALAGRCEITLRSGSLLVVLPK
ncbi:MAG: thiamine diphosphokinase, partial [Bdellovibrionales bacterium]|nr:thiamine diphosphokinase [Bdellovibrionales bacterium]